MGWEDSMQIVTPWWCVEGPLVGGIVATCVVAVARGILDEAYFEMSDGSKMVAKKVSDG